MKAINNPKAKLTLDKLRITKLDNLDLIKGGVQGNQNRVNFQIKSDTFVREICNVGEDLK
ncbi:hypothetical protein [Aquimarina mytili]|uniref:Uncharacterized protein n=1 Tax=Aquimarina mytili TaxID=874423 RepID=A0A937A7Z7_9FLAO|nr:hypothetical protein [Aquimarina mytili]MBL0685909.1 hypothetical protein [Aquimarina mytili]